MNRRRLGWLLLGILLLAFLAAAVAIWRFSRQVNFTGALGSGEVALLTTPPGFEVAVFASGLEGPRFIAFGPDGNLYVAERGAGRIVVLPDANGDGAADRVQVFADGLGAPHSLVYAEGSWFVGVPTGVLRLTDLDNDGRADEQRTLIDSYPTGGHNTRTVLFLPDGRLVVSIGSSCNVCDEQDPRRAGIVVYDGPEATGEAIFAIGLRNAVGLAIHPATGELWATNNGRDFLGDDLPPDAVYVVREGVDYGWPRCNSGRLVDPDFGFDGACDGVPDPAVAIQAHSAPLGLVFYDHEAFPAAYHGGLFVAYHGSWNRSEPTGYKVVFVPVSAAGDAGEPQDFIVGWLDPATDEVAGRPVGVAVGPDGDLFISDDKGGFIYRAVYRGE